MEGFEDFQQGGRTLPWTVEVTGTVQRSEVARVV